MQFKPEDNLSTKDKVAEWSEVLLLQTHQSGDGTCTVQTCSISSVIQIFDRFDDLYP